jgi:serine/threonine-protein kinase
VKITAELSAGLAGRYVVEREIGRGGMAVVYLARDTKHDRLVAVKVLNPELTAALGNERFLAEIRTTATLQHPNLLPLFDSGEAGGLLYYVMPYLEGESLRTRLEREQQLPVEDAVRIATGIANALSYAHAHGVIHRDLKPENVLLQHGQPVVLDFGIALAVRNAAEGRKTQTGISVGTPQYMSPEQAAGEKVIDARADIYALGALTYEMLAGEPPHTGRSAQTIIAKVMSGEVRPVTASRPSVPAHVASAVHRALARVPADRFSTAADFASAIATPGTAATPGLTSVAPERSRRPLIALAALAVASVGAAVWGWVRPTPAPEVIRYRVIIDSVPAVNYWLGEIAISPDGATIVRSGGPGGSLLVRHRHELGFTPLAGTSGAFGPFFSPDGKQIGYNANGALMAVPVTGGPPITLEDSLLTSESVTWGSDGYLYRSVMRNGAGVIGRREPRPDARLEAVTAVDSAAGELAHFFPELLPDRKTLLFQVAYRGGKTAIAVAVVGEPTHKRLVDGIRPRYAPSGHLLYTTTDGKLWAVGFNPRSRTVSGTAVQVGDRIPSTVVGPIDFAVSATGTLAYSVEDAGGRRELTWVSRAGFRTPFDSTWKGEFSTPVLSADGSKVAVAVRDGPATDIWIKPVAGGVPTRLTAEQRQNNLEPAWSADGHSVSYLTGSASTGDVWRRRVDGSGAPERILRSQRPISEEVWAPLGNGLLVRTTTTTAGAGDILITRPGVDTAAVPLVASPHSEYSPVVSPDGKWLAYVSNESGRFEVYVTSFANPGTAKWAISTTGGSAPRWSHRGDELFYLDARTHLVAARLTTTPSFGVANTSVLFDASDFVHPSISRRNYDVAADDQRFLMVQRAEGGKRGQVVVVEHWSEEMRRR